MACSMAWEIFYGKGWAQVGLTAETGDWRGAGLFTQIHAMANYLSGSWRTWLPGGAFTFQAQPDGLQHWRAPQGAGRAFYI